MASESSSSIKGPTKRITRANYNMRGRPCRWMRRLPLCVVWVWPCGPAHIFLKEIISNSSLNHCSTFFNNNIVYFLKIYDLGFNCWILIFKCPKHYKWCSILFFGYYFKVQFFRGYKDAMNLCQYTPHHTHTHACARPLHALGLE
jgi:hypothetical protein